MLSHRLQMVADFIDECDVVADIGTDHGYIPIWLIKNNVCKKAIAADISKGSCDKAQNNINLNKLQEVIDVRCGNGLEVIDCETDKVNCIVISGMGGLLMVDVLKSNYKVVEYSSQLVLQPQRDINEVRKYIIENNFTIIDEKILKDKEKYYIAINAKKGISEKYTEKELYFGKYLTKSKSIVFREYMEIEMNKLNNAIVNLRNNLTDENKLRYNELEDKLKMYREVYKCL